MVVFSPQYLYFRNTSTQYFSNLLLNIMHFRHFQTHFASKRSSWFSLFSMDVGSWKTTCIQAPDINDEIVIPPSFKEDNETIFVRERIASKPIDANGYK